MYTRYQRSIRIKHLRTTAPRLEQTEAKTAQSPIESTPPPPQQQQQEQQQQQQQQEKAQKDAEELTTTLKALGEKVEAVRKGVESETYDEVLFNNLRSVSHYYHLTRMRDDIDRTLSELKLSEIAYRIAAYANQNLNFEPKKGFQCSPSLPKITQRAYTIMVNHSYTSRRLSKDFVDAGMIKILTDNIKYEPYMNEVAAKEKQKDSTQTKADATDPVLPFFANFILKPPGREDVHFMLWSSIGILHNIARSYDDRTTYNEANVKEALKPYLSLEEEGGGKTLKAAAVMTMASLITEEENSILEDTGAIPYMVNCLQKASTTPYRDWDGFTMVGIGECLSKLAVNDSNKHAIVKEGALPILVNMMETSDEEEQLAAIRTLWTLAFDDDIRKQIHQQDKLVETLETLAENGKENVKNAAKGALWVIHENLKRAATPASELTDRKQHVFISYSWANQPDVIQIKDRLKADGYRVWFDKEQMGGSTMDAMAEAVENAAVVLICMSDPYKTRPKTRTEAEYTFEQEKPFIPLMMQRHYKPDGWLGLLLGSKFYINFDGKYAFEEAYEMLVRELRGRGKTDPSRTTAEGASGAGQAIATRTTVPIVPKQPTVSSWDAKKVEEWLKKRKLESLQTKLDGFDGTSLARLNSIRQEAPEFFYNYAAEKLGLDIGDIVKLTEGLVNLPN